MVKSEIKPSCSEQLLVVINLFRKLQFSSIGVDADKTRLFWQMPMDYGMRATVTYKIMCVSGCVLQEPIVTNITEVCN